MSDVGYGNPIINYSSECNLKLVGIPARPILIN